jgi:hypothetical protein
MHLSDKDNENFYYEIQNEVKLDFIVNFYLSVSILEEKLDLLLKDRKM